MGQHKIYTVNGFTGNRRKIAEHFGINYQTLLKRLQNGMTIEDAVNAKVKVVKIYTVNGFTGNLAEIADHFGINCGTLSTRINKNGMTIQEAVDAGPKMQNGKAKIYTVNGFTGNITEIADHFGINYGTLFYRIAQSNMSIEKTVNAELKTVKIYTVNDFTGNIKEIAKHFCINYQTLLYRLQNGMSIEEAVNIPLIRMHTKNLAWKGQKMDLKDICELEGKDYADVYDNLKHLHTLEWSIEHG